MYYIINQTNQVVAVDPALLALLQIEDSDTFFKKIVLGEVSVDPVGDRVNITVDGKIHALAATSHSLSGLLGEITLISLEDEAPSIEKEKDIKIDLEDDSLLQALESTDIELSSSSEEKVEDENTIAIDEIDLFDTDESIETPKEEGSTQTEQTEESDEILNLFGSDEEVSLTDKDTKEEPTTVTQENTEEEELFELILPTEAENAISEITEEEITQTEDESPAIQEMTPIYIDIESISQKIGISIDDYNLFLNEYIDTALTFEEALQSNNESEKTEALNTLLHLSNVLHLPYVGDLLNQIEEAPEEKKEDAIAAFFSALGRLTTTRLKEEKSIPADTSADEVLSIMEESEEPTAATEEKTEEESGLRPTIDLSDVKPIHFDFQLEEAAKDLSLPVELIEEFVNDFIDQAHEETEKMIEAYRKGDLETVQKIGHLLKGTSSNLRITPLADTLYEIQFNDELDRVPELVRHYWGHFLSLENQIKLISK